MESHILYRYGATHALHCPYHSCTLPVMQKDFRVEQTGIEPGYVLPDKVVELLAELLRDQMSRLSSDAHGSDPLKAQRALEIMDDLASRGAIEWQRPNRKEILANSAPMEKLMHDLISGDLTKAAATAAEYFPFKPNARLKRTYTQREMLNIFLRDGFIDRYSGDRLYHPGFLRLLNILLPQQFPYDAHGHFERCHEIYWDLMPSLDHQTPLARGGADKKSNWITTSMRRNMAKGPWSLRELGWHLFPAGSLKDWDGASATFVFLVEKYIEMCKPHRYVMDWYKSTKLHAQLPKVYEHP